MLSDQDIENFLNREIVIYPYEEKDLTPVGYNLNPSDFVFSITNQYLIKISINSQGQKVFKIPANDTVLILTREAVWVSKKIGGTFHSKVGIVSLGFGHISTTLDPGWAGPLLISLNNPTSQNIELPAEKSFVTLIFYKVRKPAIRDHDNLPSRHELIEIIQNQVLSRLLHNKRNLLNLPNKRAIELEKEQKQFLDFAKNIINTPYVYDEFHKKYSALSKNSEFHIFILRLLEKNAIKNFSDAIYFKALLIFESILIIILLLKVASKFIDFIHPVGTYINVIDKSIFLAIFAILISCLQLSNDIKHK